MPVKIQASHVNSRQTRVDFLPLHVNFDLAHVKPNLTLVNGKAHSPKSRKIITKLDTYVLLSKERFCDQKSPVNRAK